MVIDDLGSSAALPDLTKGELDTVVQAIQKALADPAVRVDSQRAVQGQVWHSQPAVSALLSTLRQNEDQLRSQLMETVSGLVYQFQQHTVQATLARAGLLQDQRGLHAGSSLTPEQKQQYLDWFCLDAKERLYMLMKQYGWLPDFFRRYPLHFYENSFSFVDRIPDKTLAVKVKVVGLGIGGSMAVSGLAKHGISSVVGYEKRSEQGPRSVTSRYQNASWRAYDVAAHLVDEPAYQHLMENRQRINVTYDDGHTAVVISDRVQIIIGSAIQSALDSARRYGATLHFDCAESDYYRSKSKPEDVTSEDKEVFDLVALFCGAHTAYAFEGLAEALQIHEWPDLDSTCRMWLRVKPSEHSDAYCTRGGEIGAEKWHYTIESARRDVEDLQRILYNLDSQYENSKQKSKSEEELAELTQTYRDQRALVDNVLEEVSLGKTPSGRFDYIFTNAPLNEHNLNKRNAADHVVLDGGYTVEVKMATRSTVTQGDLLAAFDTRLIVCGGDACVPPNPLAAYGATLACEAAGNVVQLAIAIGHINAMLIDLQVYLSMEQPPIPLAELQAWKTQLLKLKQLFVLYYEARSRAENYFQWVQTLICNLYSLPAFA